MFDLTPSAEIVKSKLILGEGMDEVRCMEALLKHMGLSNDVQVEHYGGKNQLAKSIVSTVTRTGFKQVTSLGITRDCDYADRSADEAEKSAFQSICLALEKAGLKPPEKIGMKSSGVPAVSAMILPGKARMGMLEDMFLDSLFDKPEFTCIEAFFECVNLKSGRKTARPQNVMGKARIHAWLSTQVEPDKLLGQSAEAGYWDWDHSAFDSLKAFIKAL